MKKISLILFLFTLAFSSFSQEEPYKKFTIPGTQKIAFNTYYDATEVTNFHWLEYLYWMKNVYGEESEEYKAAIPNLSENLWRNKTDYLSQETYFKSPGFRDCPVLGVTQEQALNYAKWRSDRVFEIFLIQKKVIPANSKQTPENAFTIQRYFSGNYMGITPDERYQYYPEYRLQTYEEQDLATAYMDSLVAQKKWVKKYNKACDCMDKMQRKTFPSPKHSTLAGQVVYSSKCVKFGKRTPFIYNLVVKYTVTENKNTFVPVDEEDNIGFRCVAHWMKWGN